MKRPPSITIDCAITQRCNARCVFCPAWRNPSTTDDELSAQEWIRLAQRVQLVGPVGLFSIGGAEPLLYRDLCQVVAGVKDLGIPVTITTNGIGLSRAFCSQLLAAGIDEVVVSLDAFPRLHDELRGRPGTFDRCLAGMRHLRELSPELSIAISTMICGVNMNTLCAFTDWILEHSPADRISFQAYNHVSADPSANILQDPLWPRSSDARRTLARLQRRAEEEPRISNHLQQFDKFAAYFEDPDQDLNIRCPAGVMNMLVTHDGDVKACTVDPPVANIRRDDPVEIYYSRFRAVREKGRTCSMNCHFLVNCFCYLNWQDWDDLDEIDQDQIEAFLSRLPPWEVYEPAPRLLARPEMKRVDGRWIPSHFTDDLPCVYLAGTDEQTHLLGAMNDRLDFERQINIIVGFPNETEEDFRQTLTFLEDHAACISRILNLNTCLICPGNRMETHPWEFYIPIPNGHHFVVEDRHHIYWTDAIGLDYPTRLLRFCQVVALLDELKIPYEVPVALGPRQRAATGEAVEEQESIAEQLADYDAWIARRDRPAEVSGREAAAAAHLVAVAFADPLDQIFRAFRTGASMSVILCFDVERALTDLVLRVQLFHGDGPEDNLMVFSNNTARAGQPTGDLCPGRYEARMVFDSLNLLTGRYKVTAGIWPDDQSERPYDVRHGAHDFLVWGSRGADGEVVHLPVGLAPKFNLPLAAHLEAWSDGARLLRLELLDSEGRPCELVQCGGAMYVRLIWLLPEYDEHVTLSLAIEAGGRTVHHFESSEGLCAGPGQLVLEYSAVNLLGGDYALTAELLRQSRPRQVLDRRRVQMRVYSPEVWGAGIVYSPGRWTLRQLD